VRDFGAEHATVRVALALARGHAEVLDRVEVSADRVWAQVGARAHLKGVRMG